MKQDIKDENKIFFTEPSFSVYSMSIRPLKIFFTEPSFSVYSMSIRPLDKILDCIWMGSYISEDDAFRRAASIQEKYHTIVTVIDFS